MEEGDGRGGKMKVRELIEKLIKEDQDKELEFSIAHENGYVATYTVISNPWACMGAVRIQISQDDRTAKELK